MNEHDELLLGDLLDGRLTEGETVALRRRLKEDATLAEAWNEMRRVRALLRADDGLRAPSDFVDRVRRRIGAETAGAPAGAADEGRARPGLRLLAVVPYVAAAAAVIVVGVLLAPGDRAPPPTEKAQRAQDDAPRAKALPAGLARPVPAPGGLALPETAAGVPRRSRAAAAEPESRLWGAEKAVAATLVLDAPTREAGEALVDRLLGQPDFTGGAVAPREDAATPLRWRLAADTEDRVLGTVVRRVTPAQLDMLQDLARVRPAEREVAAADKKRDAPSAPHAETAETADGEACEPATDAEAVLLRVLIVAPPSGK